MLQISKEERAFVVEKLFERESYIAAQGAFKQRFNHAQPCKKTIQQILTKYYSHRLSLNRNKENYGRRRTACSAENIEVVRNISESNSNLTCICIEKYGRYVE